MRLGTLRLRWWRWATQQFRSVASLLADAAKRLTRPAHRPASRKRPYPLQLEGLEERGAPSSLAAPLGDDAPAGAPRAASLATTQLTRSLESSSTLDSNDTLLIPGSSSASDSGVLPLGSYAVLMNVGHSSDDAAWRYSFAGAAPAFQAALSDPLQLPAEFQSAPPHRFSDDLAKQLENNSKAAGTQAGAAGTNAATPSPHINAVIPAGTAAAQANSGAGSSALAQTSTAASMVGAPLATPPATPASAPPSSLAASLSGPSTAKPLTSSTTAVQPTAASTLQPATPSLLAPTRRWAARVAVIRSMSSTSTTTWSCPPAPRPSTPSPPGT